MPVNRKVIVDTCIWIEFFRSKSEISNRMKELVSHDRVIVTGIILAELLQGVKGKQEKKSIESIFNTMEYLEMTKGVWLETGVVSKKLRALGKTVPLSDISIACLAKQNGYPVFTIDKHFNEIQGIKLY
ncbi:hypothetical protein MNBD_GAMMA26-1888 [hydrothermal vent metagenome]|uniref:PIN domain-containing protein n=1 Tax=hydrothermal vent metagenome TaxID=652676 RepID=A0A3B1BG10_9ZZZZ